MSTSEVNDVLGLITCLAFLIRVAKHKAFGLLPRLVGFKTIEKAQEIIKDPQPIKDKLIEGCFNDSSSRQAMDDCEQLNISLIDSNRMLLFIVGACNSM